MAVLGIRTFLGPRATRERRKFESRKDKRKTRRKLAEELTEQLATGDAAVAAALGGQDLAEIERARSGALDPTTAGVIGAALIGAALLYSRSKRKRKAA